MRTESYNLVDERWIPVTLAPEFPNAAERGPAPRVSLREAFEFGDRILDLRCYPHERIALMRLLICIAQRALDGPENEDEWRNCLKHIAPKALAYLNQYHDCFNLLGDGPRFLQVHGNGSPGIHPVFRLQLVDKDTPTLFDAHVRRGAKMAKHDIAVALLTYQSFAAGGKTGGSEEVNGEKRPQGGEHALCRDSAAIHSFVIGRHLIETIWRNLVSRDQIPPPMTWSKKSQPIWEYRYDRLSQFNEANLVREYLSRLVPLARAIWLQNNLEQIELASGLRYGVYADSKDKKTKKIKPGTYIREVTASVRIFAGMGPKPRLVSVSGGGVPKAVWRELHSIAILGRSQKCAGPVALEHLRSSPQSELRLWCGALASDQAKVVDAVEAIFRFPSRFLEEVSALAVEDPKFHLRPNRIYRMGVALAEEWADRLRDAIKKYRLQLGDDPKGASLQNHAAIRYWTALEQKAESVLLRRIAVEPERYDGGDVREWLRRSPWGQEVMKAARNAYDFSCPHATPKQLRAYAEGLKALFGEGKKSHSEDGETENEDSGDEVSDES